MFKFGAYTVTFKHIRHDEEWVALAGTAWWADTICLIHHEGVETPVASGYRLFMKGEPFSRPVGRKAAFAMALRNFVKRDERLLWWTEFARTYAQNMGQLTFNTRTKPFLGGVQHEL